MPILATVEWMEDAKKAIGPELKKELKGVDLTMCIRLGAKPDVGLDEDLNIVIGLKGGDISLKFSSKEEAEKAPMVALMDYKMGKDILSGKAELMPSFMSGKVKLAKGDIGGMMKYMGQLPKLMGALPALTKDTQWPDEISPAEREKFKAGLKETIAMGEIKL